MAKKTYVSPENLKEILVKVISIVGADCSAEIKAEVSKLIDGADYDTLKKVQEYISTHKDEYDALMALASGKASQEDLSKLEGTVESLQSQIQGSSHSHSNKGILDATTASFTAELLAKLNGLNNYDDSTIKSNISDIEEDVEELQGKAHTHANETVLNATTASFTTELLSKLNSLVNYDDSDVKGDIDELKGKSHTHANEAILNATTASYTTEEKNKLADIADGANKTIVDAALNESSENPVQNKAVNAKFAEQAKSISANATSISENASGISKNASDIEELREDIDSLSESIQPMTAEAVTQMIKDLSTKD